MFGSQIVSKIVSSKYHVLNSNFVKICVYKTIVRNLLYSSTVILMNINVFMNLREETVWMIVYWLNCKEVT